MEYITFERAMKEPKEGELLRVYFENDGYLNSFSHDDILNFTGINDYSLKDLVERDGLYVKMSKLQPTSKNNTILYLTLYVDNIIIDDIQ